MSQRHGTGQAPTTAVVGARAAAARAQRTRHNAVMAVSVVVANDFELVVQGVAAMLAPFPQVRVTEMVVKRLPRRSADVALFDTFGASHTAVSRLSALVHDGHASKVAVYSFNHHPDYIQKMLDLGADGFLSKSLDGERLADALVRVAAGERVVELSGTRGPRTAGPPLGRGLGLTSRESEVAALIIAGESNRDIAYALGVSEGTVKVHLRNMFAKLGVHNRTSMAAFLLGNRDFRRVGPPVRHS